MKRVRAALALALASAAALAACGPQTTNGDASDVTDGMTMGDATDTTSDGPSGDSGVAPCNMLGVENLNTLGTLAGDTLSFTSDNRMAPSNLAVGVQVPAALQVAGGCNFKIGHQRVFAYTARTASVLRVSTSNAGTDPGFDSVIYLVPNTMCPRTLRTFLGCNDDDPSYTLDQRRVSSNATAVQQVTAGQTVLIALGGFVPVQGTRNEEREVGNFVLTVQELTPVAMGAACDRRRVNDACGDNLTCVSDAWPSDMGHCRADGSVAGAACDSTMNCTGTGIVCNTQANVCVAEVTAPSMPCDPYHTCSTGLTCVTLVSGSSTGVCTADGTAAGAACRTDGTCDTGLLCSTIQGQQFCQVAGTAGGACNTWDGACPTGQDCLTPTISGRDGTCTATATAPGTHCIDMCSTAMTSCEMGATFNICQHDSAVGAACGGYDTCGMSANCYLTDLNDVYNGVCFAPGTVGGACRTTAPNCDGTAMCSNMDPALGRCLATVADGAACSLTDNCGMNASCVQDGTGRTFAGHCHADGTVAGAACRRTGMACDGGLTCSSWIPEEGVCQSAGTAGGTCNPRNASIHCPAGQVCRSSSILAGNCAAPTMETEPNDAPNASLTAITTPTAINGSLASFDIDCYALNVPAGQGIYASVTAPSGVCEVIQDITELQVSVYRLEGTTPRLMGQDTNSGALRCPRIDGHDNEFAWARNTGTAAQTMYVCVHNPAVERGPVSAYAISLDVRN